VIAVETAVWRTADVEVCMPDFVADSAWSPRGRSTVFECGMLKGTVLRHDGVKRGTYSRIGLQSYDATVRSGRQFKKVCLRRATPKAKQYPEMTM
jgi:hypothetical protein